MIEGKSHLQQMDRPYRNLRHYCCAAGNITHTNTKAATQNIKNIFAGRPMKWAFIDLFITISCCAARGVRNGHLVRSEFVAFLEEIGDRSGHVPNFLWRRHFSILCASEKSFWSSTNFFFFGDNARRIADAPQFCTFTERFLLNFCTHHVQRTSGYRFM